MIVYGIKNCNTVKSALAWLKKNKVDFDFHDYKSKGITESKLKAWSKQVGWESLVNKRGTTWRRLDEAVQRKITSEKAVISLMMEKTSVIKRPLVEKDGKVLSLGFDELEYKVRFLAITYFLLRFFATISTKSFLVASELCPGIILD